MIAASVRVHRFFKKTLFRHDANTDAELVADARIVFTRQFS